MQDAHTTHIQQEQVTAAYSDHAMNATPGMK